MKAWALKALDGRYWTGDGKHFVEEIENALLFLRRRDAETVRSYAGRHSWALEPVEVELP